MSLLETLPRKSVIGLALAAWLGVLVAGFAALARFDGTPGDPGSPPARWPATRVSPADAPMATLVVVVHPRCPCTRATVAELARLMARGQGAVEARVLLLAPSSEEPAWADTEFASDLARIPGVTVVRDADGQESKRFGLETSGHTLLYDASGALRFSGGITPARGHQGDSAGQSDILAVLAGQNLTGASSSVFGCALAAHRASDADPNPNFRTPTTAIPH